VSDLETEQVLLRRLKPDDAAALFCIVGDPTVMRYWAPGPDHDVSETSARINDIDEHWRVHGFGDWALVSRPDGVVIGFGGLHHLADMTEVNIGYALEKARWHQGMGTEVCRLLLDHGFRELSLPRIVAVIDPRNTASIKLVEKLGLSLWKRFLWAGRERVAYAIAREEWTRPVGP
jgi:ribosomal-protein-alanine N-acetyltransferase